MKKIIDMDGIEIDSVEDGELIQALFTPDEDSDLIPTWELIDELKEKEEKTEKTYKITIITTNSYLKEKIENKFLPEIESISLSEFSPIEDKAENFALDVLNHARKFLKFCGSVVF